MKDGHNKTKEELAACGLNDSMVHVDFMIGTADLSITGKRRNELETRLKEINNELRNLEG